MVITDFENMVESIDLYLDGYFVSYIYLIFLYFYIVCIHNIHYATKV